MQLQILREVTVLRLGVCSESSNTPIQELQESVNDRRCKHNQELAAYFKMVKQLHPSLLSDGFSSIFHFESVFCSPLLNNECSCHTAYCWLYWCEVLIKKTKIYTLKKAYPGARQQNTILPFYGVELTINNNSSKKLVCILQLRYLYVTIIT